MTKLGTLCFVLAFCAATVSAAPAQTFTTLVNFDETNGGYPYWGPLIQAINGNFYGTTIEGGPSQVGTVFKITPAGALTTLHSFDRSDGSNPTGGLVQGNDRNFYGTTENGGYSGNGTVFKITPAGILTTLHSFDFTDGSAPLARLVQATNGDLYGTTFYGGFNSNCEPLNCGTIFKITATGKLTLLHSFDSIDGGGPNGYLVQATNGDLYGTTLYGGASPNCPSDGCGTVFKITPKGTLTTIYSFCIQQNCPDGFNPIAGLIQATNGNFYGTTSGGGADGVGTVFEITAAGVLTTLHSFDSTGCVPNGNLVQATDGSFYGATTLCGTMAVYSNGDGTIFKITPTGTFTTLHSFDATDGAQPYSGLVQGTDGTFYGTTVEGGTDGAGTVFSLSVGLGPFVETQPTSGRVGEGVRILGNNLTGATGVTFNGTAATFKVVADSEITAIVPTGATTGPVEVTTPSGTLLSNLAFRVTP